MGDSAGRVNQQPLGQQPLGPSTPRQPLRLWPGVVAVALQWLVMFGLPVFFPEQGGIAILAGVAGALVVLLWWIFFSRAPWVGAHRCGGHHGGRRRRHVTSRSRVHCERDDGIHVVHLRRATPDPCARRVGGGERTSLHTRATRLDGRRTPPWMRSADARPHRRPHRRRHFRFRMAMDADSGTTAARAHH